MNDDTSWILKLHTEPDAVCAAQWDALLAQQDAPTPFMQHAYLAAMQTSGSAVADTGWQAVWFTLHLALPDGNAAPEWTAACVAYVKSNSYGEYVFDWAWADAYARHGLDYYPKAVLAVPFTPVPGSRLLAPDAASRQALLSGVRQWCEAAKMSSLHLLFGSDADLDASRALDLLLRHTVQFHWQNPSAAGADAHTANCLTEEQSAPAAQDAAAPGTDAPIAATPSVCGQLDEAMSAAQPEQSPVQLPARAQAAHATPTLMPTSAPSAQFAEFLATLQRDKRKKIQQERRRVRDAGVSFRILQGAHIADADWDFFYQCYAQTYWEHGNAPYLTRAFFADMQRAMPQAWVLFIAQREQDGATRAIACSLIGLHHNAQGRIEVAYGRYWGALERVDSLHFEACYYQPIEWCLAHGVQRFEGGAQGEHKMARALLPVSTHSAHWLAREDFSDAVARFLAREGEGVADYLDHLAERSPLKAG